MFILLCILTATLRFDVNEAFQIPKGYELRGDGHYYKKSEAKATWHEALEICQKEGASLAIINDQTTNDIVGSYFDTKEIWINCNDFDEEGIFKTTDKQRCSYTNWAPGEPSGGENQHCLQIWKNKKNYWDDHKCNEKINYVCQFQIAAIKLPKGYKFREDAHYYKKSEAIATWQEAVEICQKDGAILAIIDDKRTNDIVGSYFGGKRIWINGNDKVEEGIFETSNKQRLFYTNWAKGEPNNNGDQDCIMIWKNKENYWDDKHCNIQLNFVCQFRIEETQRKNDIYYVLHHRTLTRQEAQESCKRTYPGGTLAMPKTKEVGEFLKGAFQTVRGPNGAWIGVVRCRDYIFEDGTTATSPKWTGNLNPLEKSVTDCVQIRSEDGGWKIEDCNRKSPYICQYNAEPGDYYCQGDDDCCSYKNNCDIGEGDCDSNSDCRPGLVCGTDNCRSMKDYYYYRDHFDEKDDCCY